MRRVLVITGLGFLLLAGCNHTRLNIFSPTPSDPHPKEVPTADALVEYMNKNAERLKSLQCMDVRITASKGVTRILSMQLDGKLMAQQPRDLRLKAYMAGKTAVDIGSNGEEFWYELKDGPNYQFYCSYQDLQAGNVRHMPLPFQPEWIMETLGMSDYGPPERYQVVDEGDRIKLIELAKSPQGVPVKKIIVFNRKPVTAPTPQVVAFLLLDAKTGKEICSAHVHTAQYDLKTRGMLPEKVSLYWPEERIKLTLRLISPSANVEVPPAAFVRHRTPGLPSFDLATGRVDGHPSSLQRVQGWQK